MNIGDEEFMAVVDNIMGVLDGNKIEQREKEELLFILYCLRNEVVGQLPATLCNNITFSASRPYRAL